jgi:hypothetical protein
VWLERIDDALATALEAGDQVKPEMRAATGA